MTQTENLITRRAFLSALLTMPVPLILAACANSATVAPTTAPTVAPTAVPATAVPPSLVPPSTRLPTVASSGQAPTIAPTAIPPTATPAQAAQLEPTPACGDDDDEPTLAQTEGPYFTPGSPERASLLEAGMQGTRLVVSGFVLSTACQPVGKALIDVWQCDDAGVYDNTGYRLRGHQFTDAQGHYAFETIVPGLYPGRTRHIHVKVQAPNQPVLTSQLYFPGEPRNRQDGIYNQKLEMALQANADGSKQGAFNFVLAL